MADATREPRSAKRAPGHRPRHAVPSLYAPSPRESVVAAALAVALLSVFALVLSGVGGSAAAERTHRTVAAGTPTSAAQVSDAGAVVAEGPLGYGGAATPTLIATASTGAAATPTGPAPILFPASGVGAGAASALAASGIPATALTAYQRAAARQDRLTPDCRLSWPLLAAIGRVESNHGRFAGAVLHTDGLSTPPVVGIPLNGNGTAVIRDTDGGRLDGDTVYDRAVGPMQFIPSTWAAWAVDGDGDGVKNPYDIFDATAAAAAYLCAAGRDLGTYRGQVAAILSYNHSSAYVTLVMSVEQVYASGGGVSVPVLPTAPGPGSSGPIAAPTLPPVDPGRPRGLPAGSTPSGTHSTARSTPTSRPASTPTRSSAPGGTSSSHTSSGNSSTSNTSSTPPPSCPSSSSPSSSSPSSSSSTQTDPAPSSPPPSCPSSSSAPADRSSSSTAGEHDQSGASADDAGTGQSSAQANADSPTATTLGGSGS